jgi:quercetin dioxygenase-like cupin family protein
MRLMTDQVSDKDQSDQIGNSGDYTYIGDLLGIMPQIADDSIISRTFLDEENVKGILFGFAAGQELSEHTASRPAILHFLSGEADLTLGSERSEAKAGTWVHMPANLPHSILAKTPVVMVLLMVR